MKARFDEFLKRGGRSPSAAARAIRLVGDFEHYLAEIRNRELDAAGHEDLEAYVAWYEREQKGSAKGPLWAIRYYYQFAGDDDLADLAGILRQQRIQRKPFQLKDFRGVDQAVTRKLAAAGIRDVKQMLEAGATPAGREAVAAETGVPLEDVVELVKLSDLARLPGVKEIRARLYHDAGVDTLEKMAQWEPDALRQAMAAFIERTGFDGVAPLPGEARHAVTRARELPKVVLF